jgi:hypothetical protein
MMPDRADINIEFAHVEFDDDLTFDAESVIESAKIAKSQFDIYNAAGLTCSTCVLVDDKQTKLQLDVSAAAKLLGLISTEFWVDYLCFESSLPFYRHQMLKLLPTEISRRVEGDMEFYIKRDGKIACSHDIAIWHLLRVGLIPATPRVIIPVGALLRGHERPPFAAQRILSILKRPQLIPECKADEDVLHHVANNDLSIRIERIYY